MQKIGAHRLRRIVEMLEEEYGIEKLPEILAEMKENRRFSLYYRQSKYCYNILKRNHVTESVLRHEDRFV